jgi:TPR repeat protein
VNSKLRRNAAAYQRGDYATAMRLLRPLADQGVPLVQFTLGVMYAIGKGTPQDYGQAASW